MWRQLLYLVCTVEAAVVAATLFVLVIAPDSALSVRTKQLSALSALVLAMGSCYGVGHVLFGVVSKATTARSLSLPFLSQADPQPQEISLARSAPRAVFGKPPVTAELTRYHPAHVSRGARPPTRRQLSA
jgi:hypothetical protein